MSSDRSLFFVAFRILLYPSISLFIIYLIVDISLIFGILGQVHFYPTPDAPGIVVVSKCFARFILLQTVTKGFEMLRESTNPDLLSLIDKAKQAKQEMLGEAIRRGFESIEEARKLSVSWREIARALGFEGKASVARAIYSRERRRRAKKEKDVVPEKKKEVVPDAKANIQKESVAFSSEDKAKGGRIGPPKPIGRGRLDLGENTPDDEL